MMFNSGDVERAIADYESSGKEASAVISRLLFTRASAQSASANVKAIAAGSAIASVGQARAFGDTSVHNRDMDGISREEVDLKIDLLANRSDARARETELQAEARLARFEERIDQAIGEMRRDRADSAKKIDDLQVEVRAEGKSTRLTLIITALSTVLAIVGGVAAFNATVLGNMIASFEAGKTTMQSINETTNRLEALQEKIEAEAAARAAASAPRDPVSK